jgi:cytochrome c-type biogenesis protein CcmE
MKISPNTLRIGIATTLVLGTVAWLASAGYSAGKSYYVKIGELTLPANQGGLGEKAYKEQLRVEGFVVPGSIEQNGTHVTFVMNEYESHSPKVAGGKLLKVAYNGSEPPPDTFKDDSQALAMGTYGRDGLFHATVLQAKCASKYAPSQPGGQPGAAPTKSSAPSNPQAAVPQSGDLTVATR